MFLIELNCVFPTTHPGLRAPDYDPKNPFLSSPDHSFALVFSLMSQTQASTGLFFQHPVLIDISKLHKPGPGRKRVNT
ncbi:hypothetical protein J2Y45_002565 [Dyadobacter sp. BE34]|uniref:Uncharacterized protein n=1 Tax=Dyadobacter fermentans TaxID=94254 RepID=A0ABU1QVW7_9BACT|nr:hypothetical protein [Dyadobacter fermentans]MDR7043114.1 hypothetical protein [Dyadobacter sp. BE242]MDR7197426.1 hypothetical protein [Dyadobacter sp. BE34]MDR7215141.1 hypothetical protein [Dyadobacter sp. BE31]MDR7262676.1 hypothetical protein [Dyadobacter sp. BE32]